MEQPVFAILPDHASSADHAEGVGLAPLPAVSFGAVDPRTWYLLDLQLLFTEESGLAAASDGSPFRAQLAYVESPREQAVCRFRDGIHQITMTTALAARILIVAKLAFEKELITAEQYDAKTRFRAEDVPDVKAAGDRLREAIETRPPVTEDEVQAIVASFPLYSNGPFDSVFLLFHDMLRFAWAHELGHAVLGHARFVARQDRLFELREFGEPGEPNLDAQLQQAFELEADLFAIRLSIWQIMHERETFRLGAEPAGGIEGRLVWLRIACAVMAVLWTSIEGPKPKGNASHPPPPLRYYNMGTMVDLMAREMGLNFPGIGAQAGHYIEFLNIHCPPFWNVRTAESAMFDTPDVQLVRAYQQELAERVAAVRGEVDQGAYKTAHPMFGRVPIGFDRETYHRMKWERAEAAEKAFRLSKSTDKGEEPG